MGLDVAKPITIRRRSSDRVLPGAWQKKGFKQRNKGRRGRFRPELVLVCQRLQVAFPKKHREKIHEDVIGWLVGTLAGRNGRFGAAGT
jgi:hypothetical protein